MVETDHRPLISIIKKNLIEMLPRIQHLMLKLQRFDFDLICTPGKHIVLADTLSRAPLIDCVSSTGEDVILPVPDCVSKRIASETAKDAESVIQHINDGRSKSSCSRYYHIRQ